MNLPTQSGTFKINPADSKNAGVALNVSRRRFLQTTAVAVTGLAVQSSLAHSTSNAELEIVDTHQHLWHLASQNLPWLAGAPDVLKKDYGIPEYLSATKGLNVVQAIYMEVDVHPDQQLDEADRLLKICRQKDVPTVAAVISGRPNSESFEPYIRKLAANKEIKGVRQVLHSPEAAKGLCLEPQFVKSMNLLGELNLCFDLCMRPEELGDAVSLVRQCPKTRFVLDHCGNADPNAFLSASSRKADPLHRAEDWISNIQKLAELPNIICKISGVIASTPKDVSFEDALTPIVNHCLDHFPPDRVVFGGDWPVCLLGGTYQQWVTTLKKIIASRSIDHQKMLLSENARGFYQIAK